MRDVKFIGRHNVFAKPEVFRVHELESIKTSLIALLAEM